jgi:actin-related protein
MTEAIVIDNGTGLTKAGLSAEDAPRNQFPTIVGKPKLPSIMVGMEHRDSYIGDDAFERQNVVFLRNPIKHGFV